MLNKICNKLIFKKYHLILDEKDVVGTLDAINRHHKISPEVRVGNCGWADDANKWFIHFETSVSKWEALRKELKVKRIFENTDIPKDSIGIIYSTD